MEKILPKKTRRNKNTFLHVLSMIIWVAVSVIAAQLIVGYLMLWMLGAENFDKPVWTGVYSALAYFLALMLVVFVPPILISKKKKDHPEAAVANRVTLGLRGMPTWTDIGLAPVGFVVSTLLAAGLVALFSLFPWFDAEQAQDVGFNAYVVGFDKIVAFFTLVVLAPIAEEIIFRGWLYGKMRAKFSETTSNKLSTLFSILLVSLLFGAIHMQWNVGVNVFAMSVVLCVMREITGTIYAGILMHMVKNGLAFYLLYVLGV